MPPPVDQHLVELMRTFNFTESDLEANRGGRMSDAQRRRDRTMVRFFDRLTAGLLAFYFLVAALTSGDDPNRRTMLVIMAAVLIAIWAVSRRVIRRASPVPDPVLVVAITGPATIIETRERWALTIGSRAFHGVGNGTDPFESDRSYTAYYSAGSGKLRSLEQLPGS